jgi:Pyruvate/2-oxoacid:ferredoxin oxidoreductase delta subunit
MRCCENLCRGCGLCGTGCPEEAIEMRMIENKHSIVNGLLFDR